MENDKNLKHNIIEMEENLEELKTGINGRFKQRVQSVMNNERAEMIQICNQLKGRIMDELNGKYLTPNNKPRLEGYIHDSTNTLISLISNSRQSQVVESSQITSSTINKFGKRLGEDIAHIEENNTDDKQKDDEIKNNIRSFGSSIPLNAKEQNETNSAKYTAGLKENLDNLLTTQIGSYIKRNVIGVNDSRNRTLEMQKEDTSIEIGRTIKSAISAIEDKYRIHTTEISHKLQECIEEELNGNENGMGFNKKIEKIFNIEEKSQNEFSKENKGTEKSYDKGQHNLENSQNDAFLDALKGATFNGEEIANNSNNRDNEEKENNVSKEVWENPFK